MGDFPDQDLLKQNYAGICLVAPAVVAAGLVCLILPFLVIGTGVNQGSVLAAFQAGADMSLSVVTAGIVLWIVSLPGVYLFGYPLLRLLHRFGIRSILMHGLVGATAGAPYLPLGIVVLSGFQGGLTWGNGLETTMLVGLLPGFLVGLAARWAMTWEWLRKRGQPDFP